MHNSNKNLIFATDNLNNNNLNTGGNGKQRLKKMFTLNQLKSFCEKNNVRYEINPRYSDKEIYNFLTKKWDKIQLGWYFGMNNISGTKQGDFQWVWYEAITCQELSDETNFYFVERYSCAVGKSYKGINESWKAYKTITRRMA